ncbi:hypothetical protein [Brachybacterium sp. p3-SID957]|uniref:hypothetical protein n=1 Tax=Brachybacterium sp. p3-SID957 TaxID=2916049 RepID=UPI00223BA5C7|nr:hypothetical protein [Brachybacterium sp. p3-SID957]MCT1776827.1 hypothetical protein [Brachybacterium sp. p3-SID957]
MALHLSQLLLHVIHGAKSPLESGDLLGQLRQEYGFDVDAGSRVGEAEKSP